MSHVTHISGRSTSHVTYYRNISRDKDRGRPMSHVTHISGRSTSHVINELCHAHAQAKMLQSQLAIESDIYNDA